MKIENKKIAPCQAHHPTHPYPHDYWIHTEENGDLQIGVRGRLWVRVLSSEHAHFEKFSPTKPKARAQYGKLVLVVVLVLQSEGR